MSFFIQGIGSVPPRYRISQERNVELLQAALHPTADQARLLSRLYRLSGVQTRGSVLLETGDSPATATQSFFGPVASDADRGPTTSARMDRYALEAPPLALAAAEAALADAALAPGVVTHLVTVSCSGFSAPGFDLELVRRLPLRQDVARTHVGFMGCQGALNGLRLADAFCHADPRACVLICAVELCSLHLQYQWDPTTIVGNALFADGAAAIVGRATRGDGPLPWRLAGNGSTVIDDTHEAITWRIGDHGFEMHLSPNLPDLIRQPLGPWLASWLATHSLAIAHVASWAIHPGGPRILRACGDALGIAHARLSVSRQVLAEQGNMSSPTVLFILHELRRQQAPLPCVALGFGPGVAIEAALFR